MSLPLTPAGSLSGRANGLAEEKAYLFASRVGRGTPLDRKKRSEIWTLFEVYRSRLQEEAISEPDDAYRDARAILAGRPGLLPYKAVVVDEGQDMGGEAFRLIRAPQALFVCQLERPALGLAPATGRMRPDKNQMAEGGEKGDEYLLSPIPFRHVQQRRSVVLGWASELCLDLPGF
jgi:hypothetical protein